MSQTTVKFDVREDIRNGREPFGKIMQTVARLKDNEQLLLIAPFEPAPLYAMLAQQGFSHQSTPTAWGDWEILFTRGAGDPGSPSTAPTPSQPPQPSKFRPPRRPPVLRAATRPAPEA